MVVIARTEALIAGLGIDEALRRAEAYEKAGADMILFHSKSKTPDEIVETREALERQGRPLRWFRPTTRSWTNRRWKRWARSRW